MAMFKSWQFYVTLVVILVIAYYVFWNFGYNAACEENGIVQP